MAFDEPPVPPPQTPPAIHRSAEGIAPPALPEGVRMVMRGSHAASADGPRSGPDLTADMNASASTNEFGIVKREGFRGVDLVNQDGVMIGVGLTKAPRSRDYRLNQDNASSGRKTLGVSFQIQFR